MNSGRPDGRTDEEDIFVDAVTSPELVPSQGLKRSTRKRKSISEEVDSQHTPATGKRQRQLGRMAGVQRSPDAGTAGKRTGQANPQRKQTPIAKPTLTVQTDPPATHKFTHA